MERDGESHTIATGDGRELAATAFAPATDDPSRPTILIFPAMGAPARIYHGLAAHMAARGSPAAAIDPRGCGDSRPRPARGVDNGVDEFLRHDWPAAVSWAREREPDRPLVLIGHSFGGHLSAIYAGLNPGQAQALVLLTTSHVHYRKWGNLRGPLVWTNFALFILIARVMGYLPGHRLGWGSAIARQVILDWAGWGMSGRYRGSDGQDLDEALARVAAPVLSISFSDDTKFGPKDAVDGFCAKLSGAPLTRWHLAPGELGRDRIGHFGHLRDTATLWDRIDAWLEQQRHRSP